MKAIVQTKFGPPEILELQEVANPIPGENEVLVRIVAASINYGDKALVKGEPFLVRLMGYGLFKPKHAIPGGDIAGLVEAVGQNVKQFQPANLTFEEATAVPQAAVVALQGLRDRGQIQPGQNVLINGASGGVGTFAVQIAKAFGAEVTAVCSAKNLDLVRSLGADHVIDYTQTDFTTGAQRYDLIFDIVANRSLADYLRVLTPQGIYVACAFKATALLLGPILSRKKGKKARSLIHKPNQKDLVFMKELLESGQVKPVIDRCFPLSEVAEGMRWLENGRHRGKVVILTS